MALDSGQISAALAHGLTQRALATWHPALARTPRVMVPIQLDALVVRTEGGTWADVAMTAPAPGTSTVAHELLAAPFKERAPRKPGVYLHWALPDALTRGSGTAANGDVSFPAVPDRWLVLRLSGGPTAQRRAVSGWVIEAGESDPVVTPLDGWTEQADPDRTTTPGQEPLTALGYGDAGWAAYYDNVENRLGFHDDLSVLGCSGAAGKVTGPLGYLVCGWHSRHIDDPIGEGLTSPSHFEARLAELGWEINPADVEAAFVYAQQRAVAATTLGFATREARFAMDTTAATGKSLTLSGVAGQTPTPRLETGLAPLGAWLARAVSWPEFTLYHGAVVGIGWPGPGLPVAPDGLLGRVVGGPPAADGVTVTIGGTLTDALATRLATNQGHADEARILEAVLLGAGGDLDLPDSPARIDSRLHAAAFAGLPGGSTTEPLPQRSPVAPTSVVPDPSRTDPGVFAGQAVPAPAPSPVVKGHVDGRMVGSVRTQPAVSQSPRTGVGAMDAVLGVVKQAAVDIRVQVPRADNAEPPTEVVTAQRALPRFFVPGDPVFLLEGAGRSYKHGADGRHAESGNLVCRLSGQTVTALAPGRFAKPPGTPVGGRDLTDRGVEHGGVPPECDDLLAELALLDPGSAPAAAVSRFGAGQLTQQVAVQTAQTYAVEQTAWWVTRDDRRDAGPILAASGLSGTLPSAIAVAPPVDPWVPLHLDWEVEFYDAGSGGAGRTPDLGSWQLGEIDLAAGQGSVPNSDSRPARTFDGRALLTGGAAQVAAATVRKVLEQAQSAGGSVSLTPGTYQAFHSLAALQLVQQIQSLASPYAASAISTQSANNPPSADQGGPGGTDDLDHIADELDKMDVLVGAMDRFNSRLRSGFVADGAAKPDSGQPVPADFLPLRAGFLKVTRLRLVDCFGQVLDLAGSSATAQPPAGRILTSEPLAVPNRPDLVELAPRFTAPTRLWFRFVSALDDAAEATDAVSPLCGFVLPNHLDGDLQFHAADGTGLGAVRFDGGLAGDGAGVVWEDSPGQPTRIGASPSATITDPHLAGIAQGLLDWGAVDATPDAPSADTALSALLRIVDASLWSVDPFGHIGEEHLALLVGHPIAVMRALVRVEVDEPVTPDLVRGTRVPVRIGALAHWQDGLLAYFVDDDYRTLHVPDPAAADFARPVGPNQGFNGQASTTSDYYAKFAQDLGVEAGKGATPVDHPYVDTTGVLWVQPQQDVWLTLLMEPHSVVHATTGFLPRKDIGMRRAWVAPGLARLAPVFRFGPVLVDPKVIRMPVAADIRGTWSWSHRSTPTAWADEPIVGSAGDARIPPDPSEGQEGWLKLTPEDPLP